MLGRKNEPTSVWLSRTTPDTCCDWSNWKEDPGRDSSQLVPNDSLDCQKFGSRFQNLLSSLLIKLLLSDGDGVMTLEYKVLTTVFNP